MTTVEVAPRSAATRIRLRRAPKYEPPFDDERTPEPPPTANQLTLTWPTPPPLTPAVGNPTAGDPKIARAPEAASPTESPRRNDAANGTAADGNATGKDARDGSATRENAGHGAAARGNAEGERAAVGNPGDGRAPRGNTGDGRAAGGNAEGGGAAGRNAVGGNVADEKGGAAPDREGMATKAHPAVPAGDARLAVRRFVSACVEVLNGHRPAAHLRRLALPTEAARVVAQAVAGAHRVAELRRTDPRRPLPRARRRPAPVAVLRVHLCGPSPGAIEASVVLVTGERTWALALRLEMHHETWVATALRLV